jgi:DNA topoisomerase I
MGRSALKELESFNSAAQAKRKLRVAIEKVSARPGNTPTIRKCYVRPEVLNSYMGGNLVLEPNPNAESERRGKSEAQRGCVLALLRGREADGSRRQSARAA